MSEDVKKIIADIRKDFGDDSIFIYGESSKLDVKVRSSGSLMLDIALGGGYAKGRVIEIRGDEQAGKTTLLLMAIAEAQISEPDKYNAIIDLEHTFNPEWASKLGVQERNLFISQPDYAEKAYEIVDKLIKSNKFAIIAIDSIAALVPKAEAEQEDWEKVSRMGGTSGLNTMAMRKLISTGKLTDSDSSLIFINQLRDDIGGFSPNPMMKPTTTSGGRALKYAYTHIVEAKSGERFAKGSGENREIIGKQIKLKISKNKIAAPYKQASINLYFETGVDRIVELCEVAKVLNIVQGSSWVKIINPITGELVLDSEEKEIKFNGMPKLIEAVKEDLRSGDGKLHSTIYELVNTMLRGEEE